MFAMSASEDGLGSAQSLGGLPIAAGDILLKKYRVERLIGEGGTGIVLAATHVQLEQRVAIKFLRRALESDELRTRFEREARATGKIESEHVVLVLDAGALDDGAPYMVMEYLEGRDLARVLKEDGPLPVEKAVDCMLQVCEALRQAHAVGIVHRDLKPANLLLLQNAADGGVHVKVVDFGISKILDSRLLDDGKPHEVTTAFTVLGSPRYMAPEQVKSSKDVDGRADLWSVGAVLFQLVTGKHAFEADGNVQASLAVLTAEPQGLRELAPHAPPELEAVVNRCLTKDVTQRFQTAAELADALRPFASEVAKDSLDRIHGAKQAPSLQIALDIAPTSKPPSQDAFANPGMLAPGVREATTERKIRLADTPRGTRIDPALVPPIREAEPTRGSRLVVAGFGLGAFAVVLGSVLAFGRLARVVPADGASQRSAVVVPSSSARAPSLSGPPDAGRTSP
jgi:eukaryotic-like serine/threonine-protein kinase